MQIVIAGAHGKVAMQLHPLLRERGHAVRGLIRNPDQSDDLRRVEVDPVVCDLEAEQDISDAVGPADAVVFAAGAGPGSGAARKFTMDRDGAIKLIVAARRNGIRRYLMVSAMNVEEARGGDVFQAYSRAKAEADAALRESGLDYTIIRPGRLTDDAATGRVAIARELPRSDIPRADVAAVLAEVLEHPGTVGHQFDATSGDRTIREAIDAAIEDASSD